MCDSFDWDRDDPERAEAHEEFKEALVKQFNSLYGTEVDSIESWRGLSLALNIVPLPENVKEAKEVSLLVPRIKQITWNVEQRLILQILNNRSSKECLSTLSTLSTMAEQDATPPNSILLRSSRTTRYQQGNISPKNLHMLVGC